MTTEVTNRKALRPEEVAAALGVSRRTVDRLIATQAIRVVRLGERAIAISTAELDRFIAEGGVKN